VVERRGSCFYGGGRAILKRFLKSFLKLFLEPFPFIGFRQPILHLFPGKSGLLPAHDFQSGKLAFRVHETLRVA
jgi:hypothetical protein